MYCSRIRSWLGLEFYQWVMFSTPPWLLSRNVRRMQTAKPNLSSWIIGWEPWGNSLSVCGLATFMLRLRTMSVQARIRSTVVCSHSSTIYCATQKFWQRLRKKLTTPWKTEDAPQEWCHSRMHSSCIMFKPASKKHSDSLHRYLWVFHAEFQLAV